jgi:hypothetical protein
MESVKEWAERVVKYMDDHPERVAAAFDKVVPSGGPNISELQHAFDEFIDAQKPIPPDIAKFMDDNFLELIRPKDQPVK